MLKSWRGQEYFHRHPSWLIALTLWREKRSYSRAEGLTAQPTVQEFLGGTAASKQDILQKIICIGDDRKIESVFFKGVKLNELSLVACQVRIVFFKEECIIRLTTYRWTASSYRSMEPRTAKTSTGKPCCTFGSNVDQSY